MTTFHRKTCWLNLGAALFMSGSALAGSTQLDGELQLEYAIDDPNAASAEYNASVGKIRVGAEHEFNDQFSVRAQGLFEEDKTNPAQVDEAYATWHASEQTTVMAGRKYLPFGKYETAMLSDPLTQDFAKTRADTIQVEHDTGALTTGAYVYQGHSRELAADNQTVGDKRTNWGANVNYQLGPMDMGAGYISNIAAAKGRYQAHDTAADATHKSVGAWGYQISQPLFSPKVKMVTEQMIALNTFKPGDLGGAVKVTSKPIVSNTELDFTVGEDSTVAVSMQTATHAEALGLPKNAMGVAFRKPLSEHMEIGTEYLKTDQHDDHYTARFSYKFP